MLATRFVAHSTRAAAARYASTLVLSEPLINGVVSPATQSTVTAAQQLSSDADISLLVVDESAPTQVPAGVSHVYHVACGDRLSETVAEAVKVVAGKKDFGHIVAPNSKFGSTVVPRAAALLSLSPVTDVIDIESEDTFVRPMYAGNALAKVKAHDTTKFISVRPTSFEKADLVDAPASIESVDDVTFFSKSKWQSESVSKSDRPDLGSANIVISGGRGLKSGENFALLETLADKLGAAVGASRAAVDAGMVPNDMQVGQTGKVVAPDLYIAVGISGAIQHLSGMKDSKTIVAINKDPEAPIFTVADYGLQADLFEAVPELTEKV